MIGSPRSLGYRLSWWLALQSLGVLLTVCIAVYLATAYSLEARQRETLQQKQQQVQHLLAETARESGLSTLKHKLDDYFVGHQDMSLLLMSGSDGDVIYRSAEPAGMGDERRQLSFIATRSSLAPLNASLTLDTRDDAHLLRNLAMTLLASALVGALIVSAGGFMLVRLGLRPVQLLAEQTSKLAADTLHRPLDGSAQPAELQPLIMQFNALLARLDRSYEQLEGFNADVAHELYTPLATLISSVELAMRKPRGSAEMQEELGSNLEELRRMSGMVQDMLFLSQADRGSIARRTHTPSLAAVVSGVVEYHEAALEEASVSLEIVGDAAGDFDVPLLRRALSNLISNATRFATRDSVVRVEITAGDTGEVQLAVANKGETVDAEHLPRLFDRFYRVDSARSHGHLNHGLGLSIVAAIARMHGGEPFARSSRSLTTIGLTLRNVA